MATYPFVNFKMHPTAGIDSTSTLIFGNDQYTCLLDSLLLCNLAHNPILVTVSVAREIQSGEEAEFLLANQMKIEAVGRVDLLQNASLTLEPGDLLYAFSDFATNYFNAFVSYRALTELVAQTTLDEGEKKWNN